VFGENSIAVVKQVFVSLFEPNGFTQLLQRPSGTWMGGNVAVDEAPAVVLDYNKYIQQTKGRGYGDEEITGNGIIRPEGTTTREGNEVK
jgi:hypothetical protein